MHKQYKIKVNRLTNTKKERERKKKKCSSKNENIKSALTTSRLFECEKTDCTKGLPEKESECVIGRDSCAE